MSNPIVIAIVIGAFLYLFTSREKSFGQKLGEAALGATAGLVITLAAQGKTQPISALVKPSSGEVREPARSSKLLALENDGPVDNRENAPRSPEEKTVTRSYRETDASGSQARRSQRDAGASGSPVRDEDRRTTVEPLARGEDRQTTVDPPILRQTQGARDSGPLQVIASGSSLPGDQAESAVFAALRRRNWSGLDANSGLVLKIFGDREDLGPVYDLHVASVSLRYELSSSGRTLSRGAVSDLRGRGSTQEVARRLALSRAAEQLASELPTSWP